MYGLGTAWRLAILLVATVGPPGVQPDGNVGCLFSESLCVDQEWCYDDHAFGRCLPGFGSVIDEDLYRYDLDRATLHTFEREMRRLFALGYRWGHAYTQCELQAMLYAARQDIDFDNTVCNHLVDADLEGALISLEGEDTVEPEATAYVRYTPSENNPNAEFADEVYFPKVLEHVEPHHDFQRNGIDDRGYDDEPIHGILRELPYPEVVKRTWIPAMHRRSIRYNDYPKPLEFLPYQNYEPNPEPEPEEIDNNDNEIEMFLPFIDYLNYLKLTPEEVVYLLQPENSNELKFILSKFYENYEKEQMQEERENLYRELERIYREENIAHVKQKLLEELAKEDMMTNTKFTRKYNTPARFRSGWESKDQQPLLDNTDPIDLYESRVYIDENDPEPRVDETGSGENQPQENFRENLKPPEIFRTNIKASDIFRELNLQHDDNTVPTILIDDNDEIPQSGIFTEGGLVYVPDPQPPEGTKEDPELILKNGLGKFLDELDWGFKRRERLDVKKPGPPFDEHILVTTESDPTTQTEDHENDDKVHYITLVVKKEPRGAAGHPDPMHDHDVEQYDVQSDSVYIGLKDSITTWKEGNEIVWNIARMLGLDTKTFSHPRVDRNEVTFRVEPNKLGLNATTVASKIYYIRDRLKEELGIDVISAGVGDKIKMPAIMSVKSQPDNLQFKIIIIAIVGGTVCIAAMALIFIREQILSRKKLHNLTQQDTEASKDYQDLCRARMATKGQQQSSEKAEGVHGRITSLSRESEGSQHSPSSRSSTSSWSEEPSLTNMDISTGHMVLTYMEDHLKNKDRLEQEWVALCAYEAEPCSKEIALKPENVKKNRYMEVLPYDHARVVLNELANASSSDYINASSITDHDPRNPAYIATQGPLPHTAPDFWQMVWEQGSVVMVMLTRLTENGNAMCHRYWPEEGSEVYHIYEVHLVSEHIWCDDYLVRSFYLKNVKTGETRTVTQFHFLSWPDDGIPTSTKALLEFRRKVNKSYRGRSCPIVVHCSDGAGRTGTYCLIDMVLNRMAKGAKEIDIAATLEHIRDQRQGMVATRQQFEFVLMAVAEEVHAILKALPAQLAQLEKMEKKGEAEK